MCNRKKKPLCFYLAVFPALRPPQTHWGTSCRQRCAHHRSADHRAAGQMRTHRPAGYRSRYLGRPLVLGNLPDSRWLISKAACDLRYNKDVWGLRGRLTWCALWAPHSHAAAVLSDPVVCDLGDDVRVGLQVEQEDVVRLKIPIDDHGWVKVPDHTEFYIFTL